ncbi:MAG: outer membrane beta-barrel protein [Chromatiales bacterium]|jgi:hypothetical protein
MKQGGFPLILIPLLTSAMALGEETGRWNLGGNLGIANGETGAEDLTAQLIDRGLDARASSSDDSRFAWQLRLGYVFTPGWGMEIGYVDLGDVETTFTGSALDIDAFLSSSSDIHPNTADGFLLSGVYRHPLGRIPQLEAVVRAGAFIWSSEYDLNGATGSLRVDENGTDLSFGLGLSLGLDRLDSLPPGMGAHLEWQRFDLDDEWIDMFNLGISYGFR